MCTVSMQCCSLGTFTILQSKAQECSILKRCRRSVFRFPAASFQLLQNMTTWNIKRNPEDKLFGQSEFGYNDKSLFSKQTIFFLQNSVKFSLWPLASQQRGQSSQMSLCRIIATNINQLENEKPKELVRNLEQTSRCVWSSCPWIQPGRSFLGLAILSEGIPDYWWRLTRAHTCMPWGTASVFHCVSLSSIPSSTRLPSSHCLVANHPQDERVASSNVRKKTILKKQTSQCRTNALARRQKEKSGIAVAPLGWNLPPSFFVPRVI